MPGGNVHKNMRPWDTVDEVVKLRALLADWESLLVSLFIVDMSAVQGMNASIAYGETKCSASIGPTRR